MKAVLLSLCAAAGLALSAGPARADYPYYGSRYYSRPYYGSYDSRPWSGYSYYRPYYNGWYARPYYGYTYVNPYGPYYDAPYYYGGPRYSFGYAGPSVSFWIGGR
jgi:hypothetical protein